MDLSLFKYPVFSVAMLLSVVRSVALYGGIFLLPLFLQQVKGLDAIHTGLLMFPGSFLMIFLMPLLGRISDKSSPRFLSFLGLIGLAFFMYCYTSISIYMNDWDIIMPTLIRAVGFSMLIAPVTATALNAIPRSSAGMCSSMMNIIQQIAGAAGIAILSTVLDTRVKFHMEQAGVLLTGNQTYLSIVKGLQSGAHALGYTYRESLAVAQTVLFKQVSLAEMTYAFQDAFMFSLFMVAIAFIPVLFLPKTTGVKKTLNQTRDSLPEH
jgi:DHA2 family multidrug resistance protein